MTQHPENGRELALKLDISQGWPMMSYGLRNFPDGEIFTSPDARRTEGEIFVDLPVTYGGSDIQGIYLKFETGRIVDYRADAGTSTWRRSSRPTRDRTGSARWRWA